MWRQPDFAKLWAGQAVSLFGTLIGRFALSLTAIEVLQAGPLEMSILRGAEIAPLLLVGLFAGVWVDRLRRRHVMIAADLGRALALVSIPAATMLGLLHIEQVYVVVLLVSLLSLCFDVAYRSYLPSLVRREQLVEGNSSLQATNSIAEVSGFSLSGAIVQLLTAPIAILVDAVSFLVSALTLALIRTPEAAPAWWAAQQSTWHEIAAGLRLVLGDRVLRSFAAVESIQRLCQHGVLSTVLLLFLVRELHLEPVTMGLLFSLGGVSALFGALVAAKVVRRFGLGPTLVGSFLVSTGAVLFIPLAGGPLPLVLTMLALQQLVGDGAAIVYEINQTSLIQTLTPDRFLGRVNASLQSLGQAAQLVGVLAAGALGEAIGLRTTLLLSVLGTALAVLWLLRLPLRSPNPP